MQNGPHILLCTKFTLPPRTVPIFSAWIELREHPQDCTNEVKPNSFLTDQYPTMVVIPTIHKLLKQAATIVPFS